MRVAPVFLVDSDVDLLLFFDSQTKGLAADGQASSRPVQVEKAFVVKLVPLLQYANVHVVKLLRELGTGEFECG